jgi:hypothetical protein
MHPTLEILAIIMFSVFTIYVIYLIYLKVTKAETIKDLLNKDLKPEEKIDEYKKIKNKHMMVLIIGVLLGFVIILVKDNKMIKNVIDTKYSHSINISDVEDISVL